MELLDDDRRSLYYRAYRRRAANGKPLLYYQQFPTFIQCIPDEIGYGKQPRSANETQNAEIDRHCFGYHLGKQTEISTDEDSFQDERQHIDSNRNEQL